MDADTLLFIRPNHRTAYAVNRAFYNTNEDPYIDSLFKNATKVFYKRTDEFDSWIDYRKTIQLLPGSIEERIEAAINSDVYKIKLREIPETIYFDSEGHRHMIAPYDGMNDSSFWVKRDYIDLQNKIIWQPDVALYGTRLSRFKKDSMYPQGNLILELKEPIEDLQDGFINVDGLFENFLVSEDNLTITIRNIEQNIKVVKTIDDIEVVDCRIEYYRWTNVKKGYAESPVLMDNASWMYFNNPQEDNLILLYKGMSYNYELDYSDKKKLRIIGETPRNLAMFDLSQVRAYPMEFKNDTQLVRRYTERGIPNVYQKIVEFTLPVVDSLITCNGFNTQYEIFDKTAVLIEPSLDFPLADILNGEVKVDSINFILG